MARFDVYRNPDGSGYLLDVQAPLLSDLNTRVVVPLIPLADAPRPARHLNPLFAFGMEEVVMVTQFLAAVPRTLLTMPAGNLAHRSPEIVDALDFLISGI